MKTNHYWKGVNFCAAGFFLLMVLFPLFPAQATNDCYKFFTFKNEGAYTANVKVSYKLAGYELNKETGNFNRGQQRIVSVPCDATDVSPIVDYIGSTWSQPNFYKFYRAENRCFTLKGTVANVVSETGGSANALIESCDPPGTPPIYVNNCWKQVTVKHEGAYIAYGSLRYKIQGEHAVFTYHKQLGTFSHGQVRRISVPCSSDSHLLVNRFEASDFLNRTLARNQDHCLTLKGTQGSPRWELCAVAGEQRRSVTVRNHGAYATDLWVTYTYNREQLTNKITIQTQDRGVITIPSSSTNVNVKAKAVAGETIFNMNFSTAQDLCYEVRGAIWTTRYNYCSP